MPTITIAGGSVVGIDAAHNVVKLAPAGEVPGRFHCTRATALFANCDLVVPAGQQFVIDFLSGEIRSASANVDLAGDLATPTGDREFYVPVVAQGFDISVPTNLNRFVVAAPAVHIIVDAGMTLGFIAHVSGGDTPDALYSLDVFGHFLPAP